MSLYHFASVSCWILPTGWKFTGNRKKQKGETGNGGTYQLTGNSCKSPRQNEGNKPEIPPPPAPNVWYFLNMPEKVTQIRGKHLGQVIYFLLSRVEQTSFWKVIEIVVVDNRKPPDPHEQPQRNFYPAETEEDGLTRGDYPRKIYKPDAHISLFYFFRQKLKKECCSSERIVYSRYVGVQTLTSAQKTQTGHFPLTLRVLPILVRFEFVKMERM